MDHSNLVCFRCSQAGTGALRNSAILARHAQREAAAVHVEPWRCSAVSDMKHLFGQACGAVQTWGAACQRAVGRLALCAESGFAALQGVCLCFVVCAHADKRCVVRRLLASCSGPAVGSLRYWLVNLCQRYSSGCRRLARDKAGARKLYQLADPNNSGWDLPQGEVTAIACKPRPFLKRHLSQRRSSS